VREINRPAMNTLTTPHDPEQAPGRKLSVLFLVEGLVSVRFVVGLSEVCDLTMAVPSREYTLSGESSRVAQSGARLRVDEIPGGRLAFQLRSLRYLWARAREFDVFLTLDVLRGALNANVVGALRGVPVVTYLGHAPVEYFRCRRERGQLPWWKAAAGEGLIRTLMTVNGRLATRCLAMGPYLLDLAARYCPRSEAGLYYGVDTESFRPADEAERAGLRRKRDLPPNRFLIFLSSRISHEKDPETVLRATALARARGLDAVLLNLSGEYQDFLDLARALDLPDPGRWVIGRPFAHPMTEVSDYFRSADVVALASLAEGAAYSTLEALACGTPVVATAVGGMAVQLKGYARLTPRRDPEAMCEQLLWVAVHRDEARAQALRGRDFVVREWNRGKAFRDLLEVLERSALKEA
jgi:glycosyltransferase involved in cell wall biosynthesis